MIDDLRFALRRLRRSPSFFLVAVLTLAVSVGANAAILAVADAVLFRPLPFRDPGRVFLLQILNHPSGTRSTRFDNSFVDAIDERHEGLGEVGIAGSGPRVLAESAEGLEVVRAASVTAAYLRVLGATAVLGRPFVDQDTPGRSVMLSHAAWRGRFGSDPGIAGRSIAFGTSRFDVVGVLPPDFVFPSLFIGRPELVALMAPVRPGTAGGTFHPIVRLEPGVTRDQAQAAMTAVVAPVHAARPQLARQTPVLEDIHQTIYPVGRDVMRLLLAAALLLLIAGCANLANMMLARGRQLERDTAVRSALGASRLRLARPLVIEALVIGGAAALAALAAITLGFEALLRQVPSAAYGNAPVGVDVRVALMALALGLGSGLLFGVAPALWSSRLDVLALLRGRRHEARGRWRMGRPMIALQAALAVVLVFGAAVAVRAFVNLLRTPLGFDPSGVVAIDVAPPPGTKDVAGFYRRLVEHLAARPDVIAAGATGTPPMSGVAGWSAISHPATRERVASLVHTLPGFFEAIGVAPSAGRTLQWTDAGAGAVVTEGAALAIFGDRAPLGRTIDAGQEGQFQVVGVVPAPRQSLRSAAETIAHVHVIPTGRTSLSSVFARLPGRDDRLRRTLREELGRQAPGVPISATWWAETIGAQSSYRNPRFQALVLGSFAMVAVGLIAVGIFGLVAFLVAERTREMGIRMAIGAAPGALVRLIVAHALVPVLAGLAAGLLSAKWAARLAEARFVQLDTSGSAALVTAGIVVLVASTVAALAPARRAARVDPIVVLRAE